MAETEEPPSRLIPTATQAKIDRLFATVDRDASGALDRDEVNAFLRGMDDKLTADLFERIDLDGDASVCLAELTKFFEEKRGPSSTSGTAPTGPTGRQRKPTLQPTEARVMSLFESIDDDNSGELNAEELRGFLKVAPSSITHGPHIQIPPPPPRRNGSPPLDRRE